VRKKDKERGKIIDFGETTPISVTSSLSPPGGGGGVGIGVGSSGGFGSSSSSSFPISGSSPTLGGPSLISKHMALARSSSKKGKHWFSLNRRPSSSGNAGKSEAPFHRFPQGCSSIHYSSHLLPHEHVLGTKQPASFATYFFENFTPDPSNSVLDGQFLCTNYRILFVPSPESKTRSPKRKVR
jgi:hypothetical protein